MISLSEKTSGRENNFHVIRMLAACMVLASHAVAIATGNPGQEPLRLWLGVTPGTIAVDVFFVISGLLITQSLDRKGNAKDFVKARFLRVWPGLIVSILLTVFVIGPIFSNISSGDYFSSIRTWKYLLHNLTLVKTIDLELPGVFSTTPLAYQVNGSLWTLKFEIRAYIYLLLLWLTAKHLGASRYTRLLVLAALGVSAFQHGQVLLDATIEKSIWRLYFMFAAGSAFYFLRGSINLSVRTLMLCLLLLGASLADPYIFRWVYSLTLPYLVLWAAYAPSGALRHYNDVGDYSYGMYIYAFPIQQIVAALNPGIGVGSLLAISALLTLLAAILSWHLVEKPAIQFGKMSNLPTRNRHSFNKERPHSNIDS